MGTMLSKRQGFLFLFLIMLYRYCFFSFFRRCKRHFCRQYFPLFRRRYFILLAFCLIFSSHLGFALEIRLKSPENVYVSNKMLVADMNTSDNLLEEVTTQNFDDGLAITVTYYIEFHKKGLFFDKKVTERQVILKIRKDLWSNNFFVEDSEKEEIFYDKEALNERLVSLYGVPILPIADIEPHADYYFRTRIAIKIKNYSSFYLLVNNIISLIKYRTTYRNSQDYSGSTLIAADE